ncbi:hypothetical protein ON010_g10572 [Phytophthora cinnamomi]|nr:hypothetical protein ON010_g10572 [Phytophthora cinnamomi]
MDKCGFAFVKESKLKHQRVLLLPRARWLGIRSVLVANKSSPRSRGVPMELCALPKFSAVLIGMTRSWVPRGAFAPPQPRPPRLAAPSWGRGSPLLRRTKLPIFEAARNRADTEAAEAALDGGVALFAFARARVGRGPRLPRALRRRGAAARRADAGAAGRQDARAVRRRQPLDGRTAGRAAIYWPGPDQRLAAQAAGLDHAAAHRRLCAEQRPRDVASGAAQPRDARADGQLAGGGDADADAAQRTAEEAEAGEAKTADCIDVRAGRVQRLGGWQVCVVSDEVAVARRLKTSANSGSGESQSSDTMDGASRGSKSAADQDTSTLVLLSMGLPFVYFLYKLGLFFFFMLTYKRNRSESGEVSRVNTTKDSAIDAAHDSERDRPTANDSSTSPPPTPSPRVHRRQDKKPFSSNNAGFWVDEELQPWRLDFQRLKMIKSLNLLPTENRQTLRKQSVTSVMNPREIWLASYWSGKHSAVAVSPGGGTTDTLVVAKFIAPREDQGPRSSASGNGGGARDKLKGELKRQAVFSHPQVVAFVGVAWSRETHLVAVTEYMAQGDLRQWLHRTASQVGKWSVQKVQMLLDVSRALLYLHSMHPRLVHGNCNSRNVLLDDALRAKLSDYGVDGRTDGLTEQELMSYSAVGSGRWISPEALLGRETSSSYPDASDVYSFGILIAEMDSHELPFSDLMQANRSAVPETDILQLIAKGALTPTLSPECPKSIVKLVNACTSYKPKYRPSSTQVQQDLLRTLNDFREVEGKVTTISVGAPRSNPPSNFV